MIVSTLLTALFAVALLPLLVALHEAGYAIPALLLSDGRVAVQFGDSDVIRSTTTIGRLTVVRTRKSFGSKTAQVFAASLRSNRATAIIAAGGAAALGLAAILGTGLALFAYSNDWPQPALLALGAFALESLAAAAFFHARDVFGRR